MDNTFLGEAATHDFSWMTAFYITREFMKYYFAASNWLSSGSITIMLLERYILSCFSFIL